MDKKIIDTLFELVEKSLERDDFPVGAIIYDENGIISCGYNCRNTTNKTTDHAEIIAVENANKMLHNWNLQNKCMIVTLEPCDMCKSVLKEARLEHVYYIISRYQYKKQYKCTNFEQLNLEDERVDEYLAEIKSFFANKR